VVSFMLGEPSKKRSVKKMQVFCCRKKIHIFAHMSFKPGGGIRALANMSAKNIVFFTAPLK